MAISSNATLRPRKLVKRYLKARRKLWRSRAIWDHELLLASAGFMLAAITLTVLGGYHAAFFVAQDTGLALFSHAVWANITFVGDTVVALTLAALFSYRFPHLVLATTAAALVCTVLIHTMKAGFSEARPPAVLDPELFTVIGPAYKRNAMPSGHTATAFVMFGLLTRTVQGRADRLALLLMATLVAWSRVVCGVHWPVDVLSGAAIGLFAAWAGLWLTDNAKLRVRLYIPLSALMLGCAGYLWVYDGGFTATRFTAPLLGTLVLAYWFLAWAGFFRTAHRRKGEARARRAAALAGR